MNGYSKDALPPFPCALWMFPDQVAHIEEWTVESSTAGTVKALGVSRLCRPVLKSRVFQS